MPRYSLTSPRDGDLFSDVAEQPDDVAAADWAKLRIAEFFALDSVRFDGFDDIVTETDGTRLTELPPDPIGESAIDLLGASQRLVTQFACEPSLGKSEIMQQFVASAARLKAALGSQGYAGERTD